MAKFYECKHCGTMIALLKEGAMIPKCCDETMSEMPIHTKGEEKGEKHVPLVHEENDKVYVRIGEVPHPMEENHYIDWVYLLTDKGSQRKKLYPGNKPEVVFSIGEEEVVLTVIAHCNLHGLWETE